MKHKEYILLPSLNLNLYHNSMKSYEYMMSYRKDRGTGLLHEGSVSPCLWSEGENITDLIPKIYKP